MYLTTGGIYALANIASGSDGVVGDISTTRFELVTGGELDHMDGLTAGATYSLSTTAGTTIIGGENPLFKAMSANVAIITSAVLPAYAPPEAEAEDDSLDSRYALANHNHDQSYLKTIDAGAVISTYDLQAGPVFDETDGRQVLTG